MTDPLVVAFAGGSSGLRRIDRLDMARGETLPPADSLKVIEASSPAAVASSDGAAWTLRGVTSNERLRHPRGARAARGRSAPARADRSHSRSPHPDPKDARVVGSPPGRAPSHLRGELASCPDRPRLPTRGRSTAPPLQGPRPAVRLPDLVRVRARERHRVRRARPAAARHARVGLRRTRGRHPPEALVGANPRQRTTRATFCCATPVTSLKRPENHTWVGLRSMSHTPW